MFNFTHKAYFSWIDGCLIVFIWYQFVPWANRIAAVFLTCKNGNGNPSGVLHVKSAKRIILAPAWTLVNAERQPWAPSSSELLSMNEAGTATAGHWPCSGSGCRSSSYCVTDDNVHSASSLMNVGPASVFHVHSGTKHGNSGTTGSAATSDEWCPASDRLQHATPLLHVSIRYSLTHWLTEWAANYTTNETCRHGIHVVTFAFAATVVA